MFSIKTARYVEDKTGRAILAFTPVFRSSGDIACLARGELWFAIFEAFEDEPETHRQQRDAAIASAKTALQELVASAL